MAIGFEKKGGCPSLLLMPNIAGNIINSSFMKEALFRKGEVGFEWALDAGDLTHDST